MMKASMCIAIEPMITMGNRAIWMDQDRWTIRTRDGKPAAHFEHTIAIRKGKAEILSSFDEVEQLEGNLYTDYCAYLRQDENALYQDPSW